jgi:hypothetical protein
MTLVTPHSLEAFASSPVACVAEGGCSYLRALSTIERLAGFDQTASSYATAASRCQRLGCWAANREASTDHCIAGTRPVLLDAIRPARSSHNPPPSYAGVAALIPFARSTMVDIVSDSDGNYVERRALKLDTLPGRNDPLGYLYEYWCSLRAETECRFSNIDPVHLMRAGILGGLHVVDVSSGDPEDFRFELFGYAIPMKRPEKPRAHPIAIYADRTLHDYNTVRMTASPRLHRLHCCLHSTRHHYTRLILPFLDPQRRVERLLIAVRQEPGNGIKVEAGN